MVNLINLITSIGLAASSVSSLAIRESSLEVSNLPIPDSPTDLQKRDTTETIAMLMNQQAHPQTLGLYPTVASSQDKKLPSTQNQWYSVKGSNTFEVPFEVDLTDSRHVFSLIQSGSDGKRPETPVGEIRIREPRLGITTIFGCRRDNNRLVFDVPAGSSKVACYAYHYCTNTRGVVADPKLPSK
ncbi:hypothetical protein HDU97_003698 [Phlyctochytrium planicorne]|nr:hypothetical protein HDU97_003698 [Phlyctochytrium planicorne]